MPHPNESKISKDIVSSSASKTQVRELKAQFEELNGHITTAISEKNFTRAITLDLARQEILRDLCLRDSSIFDSDFFIFIEKCARENSSLISNVEDEMNNLTCLTGKSMKMQMAYNR